MQREYRHFFPPLQAMIITQTNHPPGDFFFCQKRQIQRLLLVFLETFVVFGDSKARITLQLGLLCSTSSGCCREPLSRPKLDLWHGRSSRGNCDMFPSLADFITDAGTSHDFSSLFQSASEHLSTMRKQFATYFKEDYRSFAWVRDPFVCTANELSIDMQEQLIELKSDSRLKELFSSCPLSSLWAALMQEYPELCDVALKILLPFASTYLCEAGFSKMTALKTKYRNRAQIEDDLRLCLSNIEPRIEDLCKAKQAQVSH